MRLFRAVIAISGAAMAVGFGVALWGRSIPIYLVDVDRAQAAFAAWCTPNGRVDDAAGERYLALFSWHYALINIGIALFLAGLTTAVLATLLHGDSKPQSRAAWLRSPFHRWMWLLIGVGALGWLHAANVASFGTDLHRRMFPDCADTIFIPIMGLNMLGAIITPVLVVIGALITLGFGTLPAPLGRWDGQRPWRSWGVSVVFGALMLLVAALAIVSAAGSSSTGTPAMIVALYLLASTRAALLMPKIERAATAKQL